HGAFVSELGDHRAHRCGRDREGDADRAAGWREDHHIDADHLAVEVECRAAGIAFVDGRIDLQKAVGCVTAPMLRSRAETMPAVTVPPSPNGLPMASTQSPARGISSASFTKVKSSRPSTLSKARSLIGSLPITLAV